MMSEIRQDHARHVEFSSVRFKRPGLPALDELHALAEAWTKTLLNLAVDRRRAIGMWW